MNKEINSEKSKKSMVFWEISDLFFIIWSFYIILPIYATAIELQMHKCSFAFTVFHWIFWSGILFFLLLSVAKKSNIYIILVKPFVLFLLGFVFLMFLYPSIRVLSPVFYYMNIFWAVLGVFWIFHSLYVWFRNVFDLIKGGKGSRSRFAINTQQKRVVFVIFILWVINLGFSYVGYFARVEVRDNPSNSDFMISFYGAPPGGLDAAAYNRGDYEKDFEYFSKMHSSFYIGFGEYHLSDPIYLKNLEYCIDYFARHNTSVVLLGIPYNSAYNDTDMMNYWTVDLVNRTILAIETWMSTLNDSIVDAIRGISFDIENPSHGEFEISVEQYYNATVLYQEMFDQFHELYPDKKIISIAGKQMLYDYFDGDRDLDIREYRVTQPPLWDIYGCMTYEAGTSTPTFTPYRFYYECQMGYEQYGINFQPWVGWFDSPDRAPPEDTIENPKMLEIVLSNVKIAKSFGFKEVVIAPGYNYYGSAEGRLMRLEKLAEIVDGFEPFSFGITQNQRLYTDPYRYYRRLKPGRLTGQEEPAIDVLASYDRSALPLIESVIATIVIGYYVLKKKGHLQIHISFSPAKGK